MNRKSIVTWIGLLAIVLGTIGFVAPTAQAAEPPNVPEVVLAGGFFSWRTPTHGFTTYGRLSAGSSANFWYCTGTVCPYDSVLVHTGKTGDLTMEARIRNSWTGRARNMKYYCGWNETVMCLKSVGWVCRLAIREDHWSCLDGNLTILYDANYYIHISP